MDVERRASSLELRIEGNRDARRLEGHAAVFDTNAQIGEFSETIRAGAFAKTIESRTDVLFLVDHDASRVLGRTRSGFLRLWEDRKGLAFALTLPSTTLAKDMAELVTSNNAGGMSIGFRVPAGGDHWEGSRRELRSIDLIEVSLVSAHPAYQGTDVQARSRLGLVAPRLTAARRFLESC